MTLEIRAHRAAQGIRRAVEASETSMQTDGLARIERFDRFRARKDRNRAIGTIALVVAFVAIAFSVAWGVRDTTHVGPADHVTTPSPSSMGTVTITHPGCVLDGSMDLGTGPFALTIVNDSGGHRDVLVFKVANDQRFDAILRYAKRLAAGHTKDPQRFVHLVLKKLVITTVQKHDSVTVSGILDRGTYGIMCPVPRVPGPRPADLIGPIEVREAP